jgi:hypothetical protein
MVVNTGSDLPAPLASAVLERAVELPTPPSFDGDRKKDGPSSVAASSKGKNSSGEVKIPKWLKLGPSAFRSIVSSCPVFVTFSRREVNPYTRMVLLSSSRHRKQPCSCSCCKRMHALDTRHIVDTPSRRSYLNLLVVYPWSRQRSIDGKVRVYVAGPCTKSANKILDNESGVPLNASQGLCCNLGIISEPAHHIRLGP